MIGRDLIGRSIRGFTFEETDGIVCTREMECYEGDTGFITGFVLNGVVINFLSSFDKEFIYPKKFIEGHILGEYPKLVVDRVDCFSNIDTIIGERKAVLLGKEGEEFRVQRLGDYLEGSSAGIYTSIRQFKDLGFDITPSKRFEIGKVYQYKDIIFLCTGFTRGELNLPLGPGFSGNHWVDLNGEPWVTESRDLGLFKEVSSEDWRNKILENL